MRLGQDFAENMLWRPFMIRSFLDLETPPSRFSDFNIRSAFTTVENGKVHTVVKENKNGEIQHYEETVDLNVSDPVTNKKRKHVRWKDDEE